MLSNIALVWKALASIAARAIWAGVVYDDNPIHSQLSKLQTSKKVLNR